MRYYVEESFEDFKPWSGAVDTFRRIINEGKADDAERYFEEVAPSGGWSDAAINDALWFDSDSIFRALGMKPDETHTRTADEIGAAWIAENAKYGGYTLIRIEIDADADEVRVIYRDEIDGDKETNGGEEVETLTAEDVAGLFGDDCGEINAQTVETWGE